MPAGRKKVVVAMSGGVDSSVTAGLLIENGCDVEGVSLRLWEGHRQGPRNCSDYRGAKEVAEILGIRHTLVDERPEFAERVLKPFAAGYLGGRTPNPCVACNRDFKFGTLLGWAKARGADYVATGHYARIVRGERKGENSLLRGVDQSKDQSYFLFALSQDQLAHTLFPLGDFHKREVREKATALGLPVADRPESQDICFGDYKALVESFAGNGSRSGVIVDRSGKVLGYHQGVHTLTVGQRKGLGISGSHPFYVLEIDQQSNRVIVGDKNELGSQGLVASAVNWINVPDEDEISAEVQIRYRSRAIPCVARSIGNGDWKVRFHEDFPSVTPGQAAVFYRGDQLLGGGWITRAIRE